MHHFTQGNVSWGFKQFVVRAVLFDESSGFLQNDSLVLNCKVTEITWYARLLPSFRWYSLTDPGGMAR